HTIYRCPSFLGLAIADRIKRITELKLCKICKRSHEEERCQSRRCTIRARPHNGLLKPTKQTSSHTNAVVDRDDGKEGENSNNTAVSVSACAYRKNNNTQIVLSTTTVYVYNVNIFYFFYRKPIQYRVLLDSGSQHNFITEALAQYLRLKRTKTSCAVDVVGTNESSHTASHIVNTTIKSRITDYLSNLDFFILPKLTTILLAPNLKIPAGLAMADPEFGKPQVIDMILGAEIIFDLINKEQIRPMAHGPVDTTRVTPI
ncbi:DUF1758 domain-containing protein, partial [Aphis craccivora]